MASAKIKNALLITGSLLLGGVVAVTGYHYLFISSADKTLTKSVQTEQKILFWYDPMYPNTKFDKPGKSPFMDMDLVPKYADEAGDSGESKPGIRIDPTQTQNLGLKTDKVRFGQLNYSLNVPANLSFNEYQYSIVQARAPGFIEKVYPLTIGDKVTKGAPLVEVTIPEWVEAQSEYILLASSAVSRTQINGVLERLRLAGMPESDIDLLKKNKQVQTHFLIKAPVSGVITTFDLRAGMNISKDNVIAKIQGVDPIWINAAIPESVAYLLNDSTEFNISIPAFPDTVFKTEQWDLLPSADPLTRTLQIRIHLDNKNNLLKPGMNAYLSLNTQSKQMLLVPSQAVIDSGDEQRVITLNDEGRFVPKRVQIFHESQQQTAIISGLTENETIVTNGLFLIDSEANISGALDRMRSSDTQPTDIKLESDKSINAESINTEHASHTGH